MQNGACVEVCEDTKFRFSGGYAPLIVTIDPGCSIRNIRYVDTDKCGQDSTEVSIGGNLKNASDPLPIPKGSEIKFLKQSPIERDQSKRIYHYDVYFGEQNIKDGLAIQATLPCIPKYS